MEKGATKRIVMTGGGTAGVCRPEEDFPYNFDASLAILRKAVIMSA